MLGRESKVSRRWDNGLDRKDGSTGLAGLAALEGSRDIEVDVAGTGRTWSTLLLNLFIRSLKEVCLDLAVDDLTEGPLAEFNPIPRYDESDVERYCSRLADVTSVGCVGKEKIRWERAGRCSAVPLFLSPTIEMWERARIA